MEKVEEGGGAAEGGGGKEVEEGLQQL